MISLNRVEEVHKTLIEVFGGIDGIRDLSALKSALARPFQTFDGRDLHPTPTHKAASLIESMLINHPFLDGNKRTGYVIMRIFLIHNGLDVNATQDEKYQFVINIASGKIKIKEIIKWLSNHVKEKNIT